ncbi:hypothetical protein Bcav_3603 [Beutenbergia cavernae DSM 12333]|uniref:Uncharacterized protein n=1 Tax=Beutenbergia cavernae (strain ATCC BAA-8 / DSM 12333 / CCUG 43141 / JCM 11478 / NBRC 16432 / NCIMB 13614 / HKI 0122) TaxID=471853 RepID=C5C301_BEUC1|nr:hypothetical protein [Beutenbergia cavernae]ACQ81845.1 hypothetical protein Bcav_3603 [Beutenbergia cavernae DSM 12333]
MNRRTFLRTAAAVAPVLGGVSMVAPSAAGLGVAPTATTVDLGPAASTCNTLTGGFVGDRPYIVSHLLQPARVGVFDAGATELVSLTDLPTGGGAWASVVDGDAVYIGTHTVADLYRLDTAASALTHLGSIPGATYVWDMSRAPDGMLYLGTYPDGKVWEYDPATGALRDLGVAVAGEKYVRSVVADETTVYAGVGAHARLVAIDRATGEKQDITPAELVGESFVYQLTQTATHVIAGTHGTGQIAIVAKDDPADYRIAHPDGVITIGKMAAASADEVYFAAADAVWHLSVATGETTQVAGTSPGDFVAALHVRGGTVVAFTNTAEMWTYDIATQSLTRSDLEAAGMPPAPELPQSVRAHDAERVYVGGHGGVEVHTLDEPGVTHRIELSGEAKSIAAHGPYLYLAMYPSGSLVRLDTRDERTRTLAVIGHEQNRPNDLTLDPRRRLLLAATSPDYGRVGGTLAIYDLESSDLDVHRDIVVGHAIVSTAVHVGHGLAFAGSERPTTAQSATVAVLDLATREKVGELVPVPGAASIPHLLVHDGVLYGTTNAGVLFAADPRTGEVTATAEVAKGRVDLVSAGDALYAVSHQRLMRITPGTLEVDVVVDSLAADPTSFPMVAYDEEDGRLYTITGRNLVQVTV